MSRSDKKLLLKLSIAGIIVLLLSLFYPFLPALLLGFSLAVLIWPYYQKVPYSQKYPSIVAGFITFVTFALIFFPLGTLIYAGAKKGIQEIAQFKKTSLIPEWISTISDRFAIAPSQVESFFYSLLEKSADIVSLFFKEIIEDMPIQLLSIFFAILAFYFTLLHQKQMIKAVKRIPLLKEKKIEELLKKTQLTSRSILLGSFLAAGIQSGLATLAFFATGIGHLLIVALKLF